MKALPFEDRYIPEPNSGCWLWLFGLQKGGYGWMRFNGRAQMAHRVAWQLFCGPIPNGIHVLHKCDIRPCVNPDHLFLGTQRDNNLDMKAKGRARSWPHHGSLNPVAKLTEDDIIAIRSDPRRQWEIAADYGVARTLISRIKARVIWRHI